MTTLQNNVVQTAILPNAGPTLDYYRYGVTPTPVWLRIGALLFTAIAAVCPWVPFAGDVSPLEVVRARLEGGFLADLEVIAIPFFLGPLLFLWKARLAIWGRTTRGERYAIWALAILSLLHTAYFFVRCFANLLDVLDWREFVSLGTSLATIVLGFGMVWRLYFKARQADRPATTAIYTAFLANAVICLIAFHQIANIGWWLTLITCCGFTAELVILLAGTFKTRVAA